MSPLKKNRAAHDSGGCGPVNGLNASTKAVLPAPAAAEFLQHLVEAETARLLARRELPEAGEELPDVLPRRHEQEQALEPSVKVVRRERPDRYILPTPKRCQMPSAGGAPMRRA